MIATIYLNSILFIPVFEKLFSHETFSVCFGFPGHVYPYVFTKNEI